MGLNKFGIFNIQIDALFKIQKTTIIQNSSDISISSNNANTHSSFNNILKEKQQIVDSTQHAKETTTVDVSLKTYLPEMSTYAKLNIDKKNIRN